MRTRQLLLTRVIILGVFLFSFVIPFQTHHLLAQEANSGGESFQKTFSGTLGDYPIMMRLMREGNKMSGDYLYTKYGQPIPLEGEINEKGEFRIYELSDKGIRVAEFRGRLDASANHIDGTWIKGTTTLPFKAELTTLQAYTESQAAWKIDLARLPTTDDVVVKLEYDTGGPETFIETDDNRTMLESGEPFLVLPVGEDNINKYSIFQSRGSHWYGGTLVTVNKSKNRYALSYIGLKTSDANCMGDLTIEIVVEFESGGDDSLYVPEQKFHARLQNLFVSKAYACGGPSWYDQEIGKSKLVFFKEVNGIRWYKLAVPIPLYNIPKGHGGANDLGEVRMHLDYVPKNPGPLVVKVAAIVLNDARGNYCQAKLVQQEDSDAYRAYLAPVERGYLQYIYDSRTACLAIDFTNTGKNSIRLDEVFLNDLSRSMAFGERLIGEFSLDDVEGKSVRALSLQEIKNKLNGKTLQPNQSLRLPLFQVNQLPTKTIYFPMIQFTGASSNYKSPGTRGRIIEWKAPGCYYPYRLLNGKIKKLLTIDSNYVLFYVSQDSSVDLVKLQKESTPHQMGHTEYRQLLPTADSWIYKATFPGSKFKYHQTRSQELPGFEWGLLLQESSAQYLAKTTGVSVVSRSKDYYGNNLTQYKRGNVIGFIVDRSFTFCAKECPQGALYEIPFKWEKDEKLMAHIIWMIRMNVINQ